MSRAMARLVRAFRQTAVLPVRVYQLTLSRLKGPTCRFVPHCSQYCIEAVLLHGVLRGGLLTVRRILRCHPYGGCGEDPVPR